MTNLGLANMQIFSEKLLGRITVTVINDPIKDVPDIRLNRISGQDLGIRFNRISGIRYIMISGIIRYPVEYQFWYYPVPLSLDSYILS